jgi:hypothetical protein
MYVVPQLLPFLINMEDLRPMEIFTQVASHVQSLGLMAELDKSNHLAARLRYPGRRTSQRIPHPKLCNAPSITPPSPVTETLAFQQHRAAKVVQDIPNLSSIPTTLGAQLISSQLGQLNTTFVKNRTRDDNHHSKRLRED